MKFFHATANQRRRINRVEGLKGVDDLWYDKLEDIEREVLDYFTLSLAQQILLLLKLV